MSECPTLVRAPNHLGDFIMALPALQALQPATVLVPRWLAPLSEFAGFETLPFDRGPRGFARATLALRRRRFARGVLLTPSFSSAAVFWLGAVRERRGSETDNRAALLTSTIERRVLDQQHRAAAYMLLASGRLPATPPAPRLDVPADARARFRDLVGTNERLVGICPGSHAPARTWSAQRFAEVASALRDEAHVVVFGSGQERERTRQVAASGAIDLGGRTDLAMLAAGLAECTVVIANDSGPLHLAAAVGARTVSIWGAGNPARTGPPPGHVILRHQGLPCLQCVKNRCPRHGRGYVLPEAYNECLTLIDAAAVIAAARI